MKFGNLHLTENDWDEHFPKSLFIEDVIFLAAESIQKKIHGNCELRASLIWINLAGIKWMVGFKT